MILNFRHERFSEPNPNNYTNLIINGNIFGIYWEQNSLFAGGGAKLCFNRTSGAAQECLPIPPFFNEAPEIITWILKNLDKKKFREFALGI